MFHDYRGILSTSHFQLTLSNYQATEMDLITVKVKTLEQKQLELKVKKDVGSCFRKLTI
jgi:hypothetical protein